MIYFVHNRNGRALKIGTAADPKARFKQLRTASPDDLILLGSIPGGVTEETALHARFADYRIRGEWFRDDPPLLSAINALLGSGPLAVEDAAFPTGMFFHSFDAGGEIEWQGRILKVNATSVLVELFSWLDGLSTRKQVVPIVSIYGWSYYSTAEEMGIAYDRACGCSSREIEE
jgi:hypothetical protein